MRTSPSRADGGFGSGASCGGLEFVQAAPSVLADPLPPLSPATSRVALVLQESSGGRTIEMRVLERLWVSTITNGCREDRWDQAS